MVCTYVYKIRPLCGRKKLVSGDLASVLQIREIRAASFWDTRPKN
jgi:hypothetical protein